MLPAMLPKARGWEADVQETSDFIGLWLCVPAGADIESYVSISCTQVHAVALGCFPCASGHDAAVDGSNDFREPLGSTAFRTIRVR